MGMGYLSGFGHGNGASIRIWIREWCIFLHSDMGMEHLLGFGYGNWGSFKI